MQVLIIIISATYFSFAANVVKRNREKFQIVRIDKRREEIGDGVTSKR